MITMLCTDLMVKMQNKLCLILTFVLLKYKRWVIFVIFTNLVTSFPNIRVKQWFTGSLIISQKFSLKVIFESFSLNMYTLRVTWGKDFEHSFFFRNRVYNTFKVTRSRFRRMYFIKFSIYVLENVPQHRFSNIINAKVPLAYE